MEDIIVIQVRRICRDHELTKMIHLDPLVSAILNHSFIKRVRNHWFLLLQIIE